MATPLIGSVETPAFRPARPPPGKEQLIPHAFPLSRIFHYRLRLPHTVRPSIRSSHVPVPPRTLNRQENEIKRRENPVLAL